MGPHFLHFAILWGRAHNLEIGFPSQWEHLFRRAACELSRVAASGLVPLT